MINVLYEDNHLLVVEKPPNVPVQEDSSGDADLLRACKAYIKERYQKPGEVYLGLVHRLDRPVGGVMVFARTSKAAARLSAQFASHSAVKRYAALTQGNPFPYERLSGYIARDEKTGVSRMTSADEQGAKSASLEYRRCTARSTRWGELTLMDVSLFTGRHHQIRCQLSSEGLALWGDQRYNKNAVPGQQIALWAYSLSFEHPTRKERMSFTSLPRGGAWEGFSGELRALALGVRIVYTDPDIICCDKDAGVGVTEADAPEGADSMEARLKAALGQNVYPVHRLDVATRGLVLFARHKISADALEEAIRLRTIGKYYACEVYGSPARDEAELHAWLAKDANEALVRIYDSPAPDAREIITRYRVKARHGETSSLEVELVTGRTHQIRAHMAHVGFPLVGDDRYGERARDRERGARGLMLKAVRLELNFPEGSALSRLDKTVIDMEDGCRISACSI